MKKTDEFIFPIGVAAKMLGISDHTIRLYERAGLIILKKNKSGYRRLSQWDIERLRCIRKMIVEDKLNIEGIRKLLALRPCWLMFSKCTQEIYESCPAYINTSGPCWAAKNKPQICSDKDCYYCPIYREPFYCDEIKQTIKKYMVRKDEEKEAQN